MHFSPEIFTLFRPLHRHFFSFHLHLLFLANASLRLGMTLPASSFLGLYPEIRQLIYKLHLATPNQHTPHLRDTQNRLPPNLNDHTEKCILYPKPSDSQPRNLVLLLLNKQINKEISAFIDFLVNHSQSVLQYELDIEIVNEREVYPTWILIPIRWKASSPIPLVHATFRNSGQCIRSEWPHGNGGVYPMLLNLWTLLERFLQRGPGFIGLEEVSGNPRFQQLAEEASIIPEVAIINSSPSSGKGKENRIKNFFKRILKSNVAHREHPPISTMQISNESLGEANANVSGSLSSNENVPHTRIQKLVLDVVSPELAPGQSFLPPFVSGWPMRDWGELVDITPNSSDDGRPYKFPTPEELIPELYPDLIGKVVHPEDVVQWMAHYFDYLLVHSTGRYEERYAQFIRPRVGSILMRCDGEEKRVWKVWDH